MGISRGGIWRWWRWNGGIVRKRGGSGGRCSRSARGIGRGLAAWREWIVGFDVSGRSPWLASVEGMRWKQSGDLLDHAR